MASIEFFSATDNLKSAKEDRQPDQAFDKEEHEGSKPHTLYPFSLPETRLFLMLLLHYSFHSAINKFVARVPPLFLLEEKARYFPLYENIGNESNAES